MSDVPDFDSDDTGQIALAVELARTNPAAAAAQTLPRLVAHERQDAARVRLAAWALGVAIAAALAVSGVAWTVAAESAADRERLADVQQRVTRIEQQLDRLIERSNP